MYKAKVVDHLKAELVKKTGMSTAQAHKLLRTLVVASKISIQAKGQLTSEEVAKQAIQIENEIA